jgi:hypothetical protein
MTNMQRDFSTYEKADLGFHSRDLRTLKQECEEYKRKHRTPKPASKPADVAKPPAVRATAEHKAVPPSDADADTDFLLTVTRVRAQLYRDAIS